VSSSRATEALLPKAGAAAASYGAAPRDNSLMDPVELGVGDRCEANYRGRGRYYKGVVVTANADGSMDIDYDDGDKERNVEKSLVRAEVESIFRRYDTNGR